MRAVDGPEPQADSIGFDSSAGSILVALDDHVPQVTTDNGRERAGRVRCAERKCPLCGRDETQVIRFAALHETSADSVLEESPQPGSRLEVRELDVPKHWPNRL